jgi:hypothetical protein
MWLKDEPLVLTSALALLAVAVFGVFLKWNGLNFTIKPTDVPGLLAPLAVAATFIERAVEILISPWRDTGANKLAKVLELVKARAADAVANAQNATDMKAASDALDDYRGRTQQYAFAVSLTLSILASISGVRALWPFVNATKFSDTGITSHSQQLFFLCVDVVLSAALLAGGADGIHSVVKAITGFFDASADRVQH